MYNLHLTVERLQDNHKHASKRILVVFYFISQYLKSEISADCQNIIWGLANNPQDYEDLILKMIHRSGKQINDLGRYAE